MSTQATLMTPRTILQLVLVLVIFPLLPMIISGAWDWREAWAFAVINLLGFVISRLLAVRRHADILIERSRSLGMKDARPWDRILAPLMAFGSVLILAVAGLDKLYAWTTTPYSPNVKAAALVVILLGYIVGSWALIENRFFSGVVRIQTDRDHHVVSSGPYRFVRHPGYGSALWTYLAMPILLDSAWAFVPAVSLLGVLVLRTSLEDRTLQAELPGYTEYARRTRYRLLPGVW